MTFASLVCLEAQKLENAFIRALLNFNIQIDLQDGGRPEIQTACNNDLKRS